MAKILDIQAREIIDSHGNVHLLFSIVIYDLAYS